MCLIHYERTCKTLKWVKLIICLAQIYILYRDKIHLNCHGQ